jgi:hypothetical protein
MKEIDLNKVKKSKIEAKKKSLKRASLLITTSILLSIIFTSSYFLILENSTTKYILTNLTATKTSSFLTKALTTTVYLESSIPNSTNSEITDWLANVEVNGINRFEIQSEKDNPDLILSLSNKSQNSSSPIAELLFVGHFYWIKDGVSSSNSSLKSVYILDEDTVAKASANAFGYNYTEFTKDELLDKLKLSENLPALISPEFLSFEFKLLSLDGNYFLDELDSEELLGALPLYLSINNQNEIDEVIENSLVVNTDYALRNSSLEPVNQVFTIAQTGVTAITRRLTTSIKNSGNGAYPAEDIGEFLSTFDLTHVSNEISFTDGCTNTQSMSFCSLPEALDTLKLSGVDIVELTGNHNNDYGAAANTKSIETYSELGWDYFGGGLNTEDAKKILYKDLPSGEKIAFIGYNYWNAHFGFTGALASVNNAGANPYSQDQMEKDISEAKGKSDYVIVDLQFTECYSYPDGYVLYPICYRSTTVPNQQSTFRMAIDFGADMVVGTQAHQPQTYEIYNGKPIFYGLGNLYFDQARWPGTRHGIVLTHYFLDGKYVQTKLTSTNYKEDLITYVSIGEERELLLNLLKDAR